MSKAPAGVGQSAKSFAPSSDLGGGGLSIFSVTSPGVVAVRDRLSYPDIYPVVAGPVL